MHDAHPLASFWQLDPNCTYLNHGSFGPSPTPVQQARARWSEQLQRQPMRFFCQQMEEELERTAVVLGEFLKTQPDRLSLVDNATFAMNVVACSTTLRSGDEIILTDHEYGAVRNIWQARCRETGAKIVNAVLPFPPTDDEVVAAIESAITPKTRMIIVSHVTSATACILPVKAIARMAIRHKVPVCVDGPHAIGMLDLNLNDLGCDFSCASCHKWLCAPFGSGFLWVHPKHQASIRCPVISWGGSIAGRPASWKDRTNWMGTRDPAPLLAIADAIEFFSPERLLAFRTWAHSLLVNVRRTLLEIPGTGPFCTPEESDFISMVGIELPQSKGWKPGYHGHPDAIQLALRDDYGIEMPAGSWNNRRFLRVSAHLYNRPSELEKMTDAVRRLL